MKNRRTGANLINRRVNYRSDHMDERKKAGLKAGGLYGIVILVDQLLSFTYMTSPFFSIIGWIGWITYFIPGVFAVHFGRHVIKNRKDAIVAILTASTVSSVIFVFVSGAWILEDLLFFLIVFVLAFLLIVPLSLISGLVYAKYKLGIPLREQKSIPPKIQPVYCFQCGNKVEENWVSCPHCGVRLKEDTRIYDDDTRIY